MLREGCCGDEGREMNAPGDREGSEFLAFACKGPFLFFFFFSRGSMKDLWLRFSVGKHDPLAIFILAMTATCLGE